MFIKKNINVDFQGIRYRNNSFLCKEITILDTNIGYYSLPFVKMSLRYAYKIKEATTKTGSFSVVKRIQKFYVHRLINITNTDYVLSITSSC